MTRFTQSNSSRDHTAWRTSETVRFMVFGASLVGWAIIGFFKIRGVGGVGTRDGPWLSCWDLLHVVNVWQFTNLVEWSLHKLAHKRINLPFLRDLHRVHMEHHKRHYPVNKLLRDAPYRDGGGAAVFLPLISLVVLGAHCMLSSRMFIIFLVEGVGLQVASTYLHDQFHVRGSWLEKYPWFLRRRYRHFYHHGHLQQNMSLGGIDSSWDNFFGTFTDIILPGLDDDPNVVPKRRMK